MDKERCNYRKIDGNLADGLNSVLIHMGTRCMVLSGHTNDCIFPDPDGLEAQDNEDEETQTIECGPWPK